MRTVDQRIADLCLDLGAMTRRAVELEARCDGFERELRVLRRENEQMARALEDQARVIEAIAARVGGPSKPSRVGSLLASLGLGRSTRIASSDAADRVGARRT